MRTALVGCCLLAGLAIAPAARFAEAPYFPPRSGEWRTVAPAEAEWDPGAIERALVFAGQRASSGVVILHDGRILAERYWDLEGRSARAAGRLNRYARLKRGETSDGRAIEDVASAQKSVAAALFAIAQHKGLLAVDDAVHEHLGEGWSKASPEQEAAITLRHLMTMTSGLSDALEYRKPAGTEWRYNTGAYSRVLEAVSRAAGMERNELTKKWLTGPTGMADSEWKPRRGTASGASANRFGFASTARDMARFGLLILAGGVWAGEPVVADRSFLSASISPSQDLNRAYGYLWWLNGYPWRQGRVNRPKLISTAPDDLVAAQGALQRKVYVVPSLGLVAVRLGDTANRRGEPRFNQEFWRLLMEGAPPASRSR